MTDPVLVERLVRAILAQIRPDEAPCACHSAAGGCCPDRLGRLVAHGAERFGMQAGGNLYPRDIARAIDHTLLKPDATREQIETLCAEAARARLRHRLREPGLGPPVRGPAARIGDARVHGGGLPAGGHPARGQGLRGRRAWSRKAPARSTWSSTSAR